MRKKSLKRRLSNILLLGILLVIIVGIYYNIRNSRAENILEITGIAVDNYGYLENEEVILEAKDIGNDQYEIELPDNINSKIINGISNVTLVDKEKVEDETLEEVSSSEATEEVPSSDTVEETLTDEEQNVENTSENTVIEIKDGKITLSKEQLENKQINLEVTYEMAIKEKLEDGTYQKELLSEKTEEERNVIEITEETEVLYSKILKYEDEENGKVVELKGYLPKDAKLKVEEVAIEELTEIFGDAKLDVAYDIKIIMQVTKLVPVDESNLEGEMQEKIETIEINPEDFSEKCEVSIKDKNILANSQVYHVKEDNTYEQVEVIENTEENISFEATTFSTYVVSQDEGLMTVSEEENTVASTETDDANAGLDTSEQVVVNFTPYGRTGYYEESAVTVTAEVFGKDANIVAYRWGNYYFDSGWEYLDTPSKTITVTRELIAQNIELYVRTQYIDENGVHESEHGGNSYRKVQDYPSTDIEPPIGTFNKTTNSEYEQDPGVILSFSDETNIGNAKVRLQWSEINEVGTDSTYKLINQPTEENGWKTTIAPPQNIEGTFYLRGKYYAFEGIDFAPENGMVDGNSVVKYIKAGPFLIDTKAPTLNIIHSVNSTKSAVTINASASETATGSGIAEYKFDDGKWTTSSTKVYTKNGTYVVQVRDNAGNVTSKTLTITEIEAEAPTITIVEPEQQWMKTRKIRAKINDTYSGLAEGATLKYGLSTSNTQEPTTWAEVTVGGYEEGETEVSFGGLVMGLTGKYYLWVKPVSVKDVVGNEATGTVVSSNTYWCDNTAPTININETLTATNITAEDYGGYVTNYTASNGTNSDLGIGGWRIFHSDGENIYLIADDYVNRIYVPAGKGGTAVGIGSYPRGFPLAPYANYAGWTDISSTLKTKLLSQYVASGYESTNDNMKATAYLLDTNVWSGFKDSSGYADYAIGGPTLELFAASYNKTHETDIETQVSSEHGYQLRFTGGTFHYGISGLDTSESLYVIGTYKNARGMWVASPPNHYTYYMMVVEQLRLSVGLLLFRH